MRDLISLFLKCFLNKKNNYLILVCLSVLIISSVLSLDFTFDLGIFLLKRDDFIDNYLSSISVIVLMINSIVIPLFISDISKEEHVVLKNILKPICGLKKIFIARIVSITIIIIYLSILEFIIIMVPPILYYPSNNLSIISFFNIISLFLCSFFSAILVYLIIEKIKSVMVCIIPMLIFFVIQGLSEYIGFFKVGNILNFSELNVSYFLFIMFIFSLNLVIFWLRYATLLKHDKKIKKTKKNIDIISL